MSGAHGRVLEMLGALKGKSKGPGGLRTLAELLEQADAGTARKIMDALRQTDPQLARDLEEHCFTFDDIVRMDDRIVKKVLPEVPRATLALALKGADDAIRAKILGCMSERAASMLEDDMRDMGPVHRDRVEEARRETAAVLRPWRDAIV